MTSIEVVLAVESAELPVSAITAEFAASCVGRPMMDENGVQCGTVVSARRVWVMDRLQVVATIEMLPGRLFQPRPRGRRRL